MGDNGAMRADASKNRERIIAAARTLLARAGLDVSYRALAEEAGVGVATVHRHFPDREDLLFAIARDNLEFVRAIEERFLPMWAEDPEGAWRGVIAAIADSDLPALGESVFSDDGLTEEFVEQMEPMRRLVGEFIARLLDRAAADGLIRDDVDAPQFMLALFSVLRPWSDAVYAVVPGHREWMIDMFVRGLRP